MILPGILSSQISGHLYSYSTDFYQIATATVDSGGASSISFTSIPQTYKHLQLRILSRASGSGSQADTQLTFNADNTSGHYHALHYIYGDGSGAYGGQDVSSTFIYNNYQTASGASSGIFGVGITDILDYTNTNKNKVTRTLTGNDLNGSGSIWLRSGLWLQTSAINQINITSTATGFAQYTQFALYGAN